MLIRVYEWYVNDAGDRSIIFYHYTVLKLIKLFFFFVFNKYARVLTLGVGDVYNIISSIPVTNRSKV